MNTMKLIILIFTMVGSIFTGCTSRNTDLIPEQIESLMNTYNDIGQFDGSVLVADGEGVIFKGGFGLSNREWETFNDPETKFRIGSVTKQFTAALILKLAEEGLLDLDQMISDYQPDFRQDIGGKVSIHHLLTHTSGISLPDFSMEEYDSIFQKELTTEQILQLSSGDLLFEPGSKFRYSSAGYMILGAIIEEITSKTYAESLKDYILCPLDMNDTGVDNYEDILPKRASGYQTNYGLGNARFKYMPSSFSSGSLYSTVEDMHKWFSGLCSGKLLKKESVELIFSKHIVSHRGFYGYGWFIDDRKISDALIPLVFHAGDVNGFSAIIMGNPSNGQVVILLSNQEGTHYYDIAYNLFNIINNTEVSSPLKYVADLLREAAYTEGKELMQRVYQEICDIGIDNFNADENELIELGYDLQFKNKFYESVEVLKINTILHPDSYNAFDCLGEAYYNIMEIDLAILSYEESLRLNPENDNANRMIQKLKPE